MAKEPYKDPFGNLKRPNLYAPLTRVEHDALKSSRPDVAEILANSKPVTKTLGGRPRKSVTKTPAQRAAAYRASKKLGARSPNPA
jgi:hypothetical protein